MATLLSGIAPRRLSDIWRPYLLGVSKQLLFTPFKIFQERNAHGYIGNLNTEQDIYGKGVKLIDFLSEWDSD